VNVKKECEETFEEIFKTLATSTDQKLNPNEVMVEEFGGENCKPLMSIDMV
jgi:hypothetical protein